MLWQVCLRMNLALITLYMHVVDGYTGLMYAVDFSYSTEEILECTTTKSVLGCAVGCLLVSDCVAIEFQDENSKCVILKSVTTTSELMNKKQFVKLVSAEGVFGLSSYFMTHAAHNETECQRVCAMYGGYHATVTSKEENDFIKNLRKEQTVFIGGVKTSDVGSTWAWVNGEDWGYTNWYPGEPNISSGKICIGFWKGYTGWDDSPCYERRKCMCEKALA